MPRGRTADGDVVTFLIPVRHPDNAKDWGLLKRNLAQTVRSISSQNDERWRGVIVANQGADLPDLPNKFSVVWVDFEPNPQNDIHAADLEVVYDTFRFDKGRRVLAGALGSEPTEYLMVCDDDDFISCNLTSFIADKSGASGWTINKGYVWFDGGRLLYRHDDFNNLCGTSHIVRWESYGFPNRFDQASADYIKMSLGSHRQIDRILAERGQPLSALPFHGAIYRTGHATAHSQSKGLRATYFTRDLARRPREFARRLLRLRLVSKSIRDEFWGG
jgi:hypothetical protein